MEEIVLQSVNFSHTPTLGVLYILNLFLLWLSCGGGEGDTFSMTTITNMILPFLSIGVHSKSKFCCLWSTRVNHCI